MRNSLKSRPTAIMFFRSAPTILFTSAVWSDQSVTVMVCRHFLFDFSLSRGSGTSLLVSLINRTLSSLRHCLLRERIVPRRFISRARLNSFLWYPSEYQLGGIAFQSRDYPDFVSRILTSGIVGMNRGVLSCGRYVVWRFFRWEWFRQVVSRDVSYSCAHTADLEFTIM